MDGLVIKKIIALSFGKKKKIVLSFGQKKLYSGVKTRTPLVMKWEAPYLISSFCMLHSKHSSRPAAR